MSDKNPPQIRPANIVFDKSGRFKTQTFFMDYVGAKENQSVFFSVSEPDYKKPKGTVIYFVNCSDEARDMANQIEMLTDAGYRVVTFDAPGTGESSKNAKVPAHLLDYSLNATIEAGRMLTQHIQETYDKTPLHFIGEGTGFNAAGQTLQSLKHGSVASLLGISPATNFELEYFGETPRFRQDVAQHARGNTCEASNLEPGATVRSVIEMTSNIAEINRSNPALVQAIRNSDVKLGIVYDPEVSSPFMGNRGTFSDWDNIPGRTPENWLRAQKLDADVNLLPRAGEDPLKNRATDDRVLAAFEANAEAGTVKIKTINALRSISDAEWKKVPVFDRKNLQMQLQKLGYDIGPSGVDGVIRYGNVSDTEHALADLLQDNLGDVVSIIDQQMISADMILGTVNGFYNDTHMNKRSMFQSNRANIIGRSGSSTQKPAPQKKVVPIH